MTDDEKRERRRAYQAEYHRRLRESGEAKRYKREWYKQKKAAAKGRRDAITAWHNAFLARHTDNTDN